MFFCVLHNEMQERVQAIFAKVSEAVFENCGGEADESSLRHFLRQGYGASRSYGSSRF